MRIKWIINGVILSAFIIAAFACSCSKNTVINNPPVIPPTAVNEVDYWLTTANQATLLKKQAGTLAFGRSATPYAFIDVDSTHTYQSIDGFGYTLTGGSAYLLNHLSATDKAALLQELFGTASNSISVSYLRVSIGASDLSASVFSYDDLPAGHTDITLDHFNLSLDTVDLIPLLKEILAINPNIKILGSPWSAPVWMKDNANSVGGTLLAQYYSVYANYFVKYIQAMKTNGITIDAVTIQNEPQNPNNNPSMELSAQQEADFIKNNLGPAFRSAGLATKIIVWDHNADNPNYPINVLNDAAARPFIDGSAFHLYGGDISALSTVHDAHSDRNLYFTEQWTGSTGTFNGDFMWHIKNVVIGSMRNWCKTALEWNLANDPTYGPHTPGGCTECKGALTIGTTVNRNVGYYIIAQVSKFVPAGSVRISSTEVAGLPNAAFKTPSGKKVLLVLNESSSAANFNIRFRDKWVTISLPASSAGTFIW